MCLYECATLLVLVSQDFVLLPKLSDSHGKDLMADGKFLLTMI